MTSYDFRYRLQSTPEPTTDGTGGIHLDMWAVSRISGTTDPFTPFGPHITVVLLSSEVKVVNDMPHSTPAEKTAKRRAFKDLVKTFLRRGGFTPVTPEWTQEGLQAYLDANDSSTLESSRLDNFITVVLNNTYPWDVAINV